MSFRLNTKALERFCNLLPNLTLEEAGTALAELANEAGEPGPDPPPGGATAAGGGAGEPAPAA